jgi:polysaccharide biosynthesis/export protein
MKPMSRLNLSITITAFLCMIIFASSCGTDKKITYFKNIPDTVYNGARNIPSLGFSDPIIQPNDILQVSILTLDPQVNTVLTAGNTTSFAIQPGSSTSPVAPTPISGLLVDNQGTIELPVVGRIKVAGLTTSVAKDSIRSKVSLYYNSPVVNVRFANFSITILGEVARPASYVVPNEKVSILDAIGMAGDLTIFGKRENVLLIRDSLGQKQYVRFNLNSADMFSSPYFYLKQGDMIYVEPGKSKIASTDAVKTRNISLIATGISLLIVIFSRI